MPLQPLPASAEPYTTLIDLLSPSPPQILELDILPSSHPLTIHSAAQCVALPKSLLASLFLTARTVFFSHLASQKHDRPENEHGSSIYPKNLSQDVLSSSSYIAAHKATLIILLWDPNHLTAANFRKRHLLHLRTSPSFLTALDSELAFLSSLFTSPLTKATKSPTLWAQRHWLLHTFGAELITQASRQHLNPSWDGDGNVRDEKQRRRGQNTWDLLLENEMQIVMRAGDRHPRNYYAWNYARKLLALFLQSTSSSFPTSIPISTPQILSLLTSTHKYCLQHSRDISAWSFLLHLFHYLHWSDVSPFPSPSPSPSTSHTHAYPHSAEQLNRNALEEMERVVCATREFVRKFEWRGESVEWFLGMVERERENGKGRGGVGGKLEPTQEENERE